MKKFFTALTVALLLVCCGCGAVRMARDEQAGGDGQTGQTGRIQQVQTVDTVMGTVLIQTLYTTDAEAGTAAEIMALLRELEEGMLSRRQDTSEVAGLNRAAGRPDGSSLSAEMEELLEGCLEMWRKSEGAFDVTLGSVVELWDIDGWAAGEREGTFAPPEKEQLAKALEHCGSGSVEIKEGCLYLPEGMELDLGAVGKGVALDHILAYLQEQDGITGAIISLGGSVLTCGEKPEGGSWNVGIADPRNTASNVGILTLEGEWFISTSGDYERYAEAGGARYHHIIDPATGCPADSGVAGVTILAKSGFLSDALSTACFILGAEKGMALAEDCGAEVLFVGKDGSITMSEGMKAYYVPASGSAGHRE
ncbi:MAG: FAD:protein FMN transferase [Butyrivibrio sp.]|nr:FAD:protein FMN transferase [Acetatifactor muris]MCM1559984.1 FAD:protein FMN transferase [Butyrivibrio sp.]